MIGATQLEMAEADDNLSTQPHKFLYIQVVERCQIFSFEVPSFEEVQENSGHLAELLIQQFHDRYPELFDYARLGQVVAILALTNFGDRMHRGPGSAKDFIKELVTITGRHGISESVVRSWASKGRRARSPFNTVIDFERLVASMQPFGNQLIAVPTNLKESVARFRKDHPNPRQVGFLIMKFGTTRLHLEITKAIQATLEQFGISAIRADQKEYNSDLFSNVLTYI